MHFKVIIGAILAWFPLTQHFSVVAEEPPKPISETPWETFRLPANSEREFSVEQLPDKVKHLDGKRLRIRGYILPSSVFAIQAREFVLAGEVKDAAVVKHSGDRIPLDACMHVRMNNGGTVRFHFGPIALTGTFRVRPIRNKSGEIVLVYFFDADSVERVEKRPSHGPAVIFDL